MRIRVSSGIAFFFLTIAANASAAIITEYDLDTQPGTQMTQSATSSASNVVGLDMQRGPGLIPRPTNNFDTFTSIGFDNAADDYVTFGFSVDPGFQVNLDDLRIGLAGSGGTPNQFQLFFSGDNYASSLATFDFVTTSDVNTIVPLASLGTLTGLVQFRLLATSTTPVDLDPLGTTRTSRLFVFNYADLDGVVGTGSVSFNGTVTAVPEPASLALLGIVSTLGWVNRRRLTKA